MSKVIELINGSKRKRNSGYKRSEVQRSISTEDEIVALLREKGKLASAQNAFEFDGDVNIGPATYEGDAEAYGKYVMAWVKAQSESTEFNEQFDCLFGDGAAAVARVAQEFFGGFIGKKTIFSPPQMLTIKTGPGTKDTIQVPTGQIRIELLEADLYIANNRGKLQISVETTKAKEPLVRGLLEMIRDDVRENSIYRGKSLQVGNGYSISFMNLTAIDPRAIFYNNETMAALNANVWTMIEKRAQVLAANLTTKSNVLLHGPYGTGKSLAAMLTAMRANRHGWTYVQVAHGESLDEAFDVALMLAPAVIVVEDIDTRITGDRDESTKLMELLDGTLTKGKEIIGLFTTNHPEMLQAGQWRKGRIDEQIEIGRLAPDKMRQLVEYRLGDYNSVGENSEDWAKILEAMDNMVPAYVDSVVRAAKLYAIAGDHEKEIRVDDLCNAAKQARAQLAFQERASSYNDVKEPTIDAILKAVIESSQESTEETVRDQGSSTRDTVVAYAKDILGDTGKLKKAVKATKEKTDEVKQDTSYLVAKG